MSERLHRLMAALDEFWARWPSATIHLAHRGRIDAYGPLSLELFSTEHNVGRSAAWPYSIENATAIELRCLEQLDVIHIGRFLMSPRVRAGRRPPQYSRMMRLTCPEPRKRKFWRANLKESNATEAAFDALYDRIDWDTEYLARYGVPPPTSTKSAG